MKELKTLLKRVKKKKILLLGIGNPEKGDDGVGPSLTEELRGKIKMEVLNAGMTPENYLGEIKKIAPHLIFVIDAAEMGGKAGEIFLVREENLPFFSSLSTHLPSLRLLVEILKSEISSLSFYFLLIQPHTLEFGQGLSPKVFQTKEKIKELFLSFFG